MNSIFNEHLFAPFRSSSALEKITFLDFSPYRYYGGQNSIIRPEAFTKTVHLWSENWMTVSSSYCNDDFILWDTIALIISAWRMSISKSKLASPKLSCKLFIIFSHFTLFRVKDFFNKLQSKGNANITWYNILRPSTFEGQSVSSNPIRGHYTRFGLFDPLQSVKETFHVQGDPL